jgi:hypothetical protein
MKYTYDYFSRNREITLRKLLNIEGSYSSISIREFYGEGKNPNENRAINSLDRGLYIIQKGNSSASVDDLLNCNFSDILKIRNAGKGSHIIILNGILDYFKLGKIIDEPELIRSYKCEIDKLIQSCDNDSLKEIIYLLFEELSIIEAEKALRKIKDK